MAVRKRRAGRRATSPVRKARTRKQDTKRKAVKTLGLEVKGMKELRKCFRILKPFLYAEIVSTLADIVSHVSERAVNNAPILSAELRSEIYGEVEGQTVMVGLINPNETFKIIEGRRGGRLVIVSPGQPTVEYSRKRLMLKLGKRAKKKVKGFVADNIEYARYMHEGDYQLGPISALQPPTPEGGVGPRYISRVVWFHIRKYQRAMGEVAERAGAKAAKVAGTLKVSKV